VLEEVERVCALVEEEGMDLATESWRQQSAILAKATEEFCRKYRIRNRPGREAAARLAMLYFRSGKRTQDELREALEADD
jgi:hypothetical protein